MVDFIPRTRRPKIKATQSVLDRMANVQRLVATSRVRDGTLALIGKSRRKTN